jgi:hypothetical protein
VRFTLPAIPPSAIALQSQKYPIHAAKRGRYATHVSPRPDTKFTLRQLMSR